MTDLVERLRAMHALGHDPVMREAADEIERLRAEFELFREAPSKLEVAQYEIERLRVALEIIAGRRQCLDNLMGNVDVACEALDGGKP